MTVYVDLIFLTNLLINGATLHTTAWTRKLKVKFWRLTIAAAIGATYALMMFVPQFSVLFSFGIKVLFSLAMVWTAFGFGSLQTYIRNLGAFYFVNFAAAGCLFAVHYMMQSSHDVMNGILFTQSGGLVFQMKVGLLFVLLGLIPALWWYKAVIRSKAKREELLTYTARIEIQMGETSVSCTGLVDTGNRLYEPLTRTPVMITNADLWKDVMPQHWLESIRRGRMDDLLQRVGDEEFALSSRVRFVPYRGIQHGTNFMLALKPDKVVLQWDGKSSESTRVLIGLKGESASSDGSYQAIIHPDLLQINPT